VKQPFSRFILKEDQDIFYLMRKKLLQTTDPQTCELRVFTKDETTRWVHLTATVAQVAGAAPALLIVLSDISERKRAEAGGKRFAPERCPTDKHTRSDCRRNPGGRPRRQSDPVQ
jgi:hypothetical protein